MSYRADAKGVFHSTATPVDRFPDDMDMFTFMFDYFPAHRPDVRGTGLPLFIDEETGLRWTFEQTRERVELLSIGLRRRVGVEWDTRVGLFSPNTMDYGVMIWATHRVGGVISAANPSFGPSELSYQLDTSKSSVLFLHDIAQSAGFDAAEKAGIRRNHVILVQDPAQVEKMKRQNNGQVVRKIDGAWTVEGLIEEGRELLAQEGQSALNACRVTLQPGQAKSKLAFLSFSSGTTGLPKGVAIQHFAPISNILQHFFFNRIDNKIGNKQGRFRPGVDVMLGILPMFHIYALVLGLHATFYQAVTNVIIPKFRGIVPMLETAIKYRASLWYLVPPQIVLFCKDPKARALHAQCREFVNFVMIGAAPLSDDLSAQFQRALPGVDWGQGYGMTETCTLTLMHPRDVPCILGSAGQLVSDVEARIVSSSDGKSCGIDEAGELWIRSPSNALGYSNNEQATREMWVENGWVRTGDEAKADVNGNFYIVDRLKELIKVKGFQVAPAELEGWLLNHNDISDAMVVGIPDDHAGEVPLAFVTLTADAQKRCTSKETINAVKQSILKHVSDHKIRYKHLHRVEIIDAIPKTASGKILRRTGREMAKKLTSDDESKSRL